MQVDECTDLYQILLMTNMCFKSVNGCMRLYRNDIITNNLQTSTKCQLFKYLSTIERLTQTYLQYM